MCRLFGFRSNVPAPVHASLVSHKNSLLAQSREHKDGWGIATYAGERPNVAHGLGAAHADPQFERVSSNVHSHAVLAHIRLASVGPIHLHNAHPFVHGRWAFAHNGTVRNFDKHRNQIESLIDGDLRARLCGDTDSERCFYAFLSVLRRRTDGLVDRVEDVAWALAEVTRKLSAITDLPDVEKPSSMNFLVTDGELMVGTRRNRTLFFSEHKKKGQDPSAPPATGTKLEQLVIASEELSFEDHWHEVPENGVVAVGPGLTLRRWMTDELR